MRRPTLTFRAERPGFSLRPVCGRRAAQSRNLSTMHDSFSAFVALDRSLVYAQTMLDEKDFQRRADAAFDDLKRRLLTLGDEHGFDVEGESGKLEVIFEEPEEAKFVVSPNTPVREIWISALSTSFKLGWSDSKNAFILEKTGENLFDVMSRVLSQQLGTQVKL
jgi:iron donor protein CyaY